MRDPRRGKPLWVVVPMLGAAFVCLGLPCLTGAAALDFVARCRRRWVDSDFGTGHSTLDILNRYPLGTLKIDISFTRTMLDSERSAEIVYSSIQLAHSLDMDVVAEGVENEAVREKLLALGCNYGQGWLFGRPLPIS